METTAFVFALCGIVFAIRGLEKIAVLKKELETLKKDLRDSGTLSK